MARQHSIGRVSGAGRVALRHELDDWQSGCKSLPRELRKALTDYTLKSFFGEDARPGTWKSACAQVQGLANPLTDSFNLGKEWAWKHGRTHLNRLSDVAFLKVIPIYWKDAELLGYLKRESEKYNLAGRKAAEGARKGRAGRRRKINPHEVEKLFRAIKEQHPHWSAHRVHCEIASQCGATADAVRKALKKTSESAARS